MERTAMTDSDKIVAAILAAKACAPGADPQGYLEAYFNMLDNMEKRENKKSRDNPAK